MTDAEGGIAALFDDLVTLAANCRFRDCQHETEPGCAIRQALDQGQIDAPRVARWRKLAAEERFNSSTLSERKMQGKSLRKMVKASQQKKNRR
ncbi:hypothetical protein [Phaeobacter sp. HF9A]|uniref:hypothetical protein n=1 Tax=Phaeobacter sp. HF9A TaxID=2721561 RepID=UPI0034C62C6C